MIGFGLNWGKPHDSGLDDQYTAEVFYRLQATQNLSIRSLKACLQDFGPYKTIILGGALNEVFAIRDACISSSVFFCDDGNHRA